VSSRIKMKGARHRASRRHHRPHRDRRTLPSTTNPLPRWWMWCSGITIVYAVVYLVFYPGLGRTRAFSGGRRPTRPRRRAPRSSEDQPLYDKYLAMDLKQVAADPQARAMGERLFLHNWRSAWLGCRGQPRLPSLRGPRLALGRRAGDDSRIDRERADGRDAGDGPDPLARTARRA